MLNGVTLLGEIRRLVAGVLPECRAVYLEEWPPEPEQPSALVRLVESTQRTINLGTVEYTERFSIVCRDAQSTAEGETVPRLLTMRQRVQELFVAGFLRMEGRAPKVSAKAAGCEEKTSAIEVTIVYNEALPQPEPPPLMREVTMNLKEETK